MDAMPFDRQTAPRGPRMLTVRRATPSLMGSDDLRIGDWLVQPTLGRVSKGEEVVRLRPQLMDVLLCLASRHGRTVMKREVLDTVWNDHFVNESALARCIAELRQVLGDNARNPQVIETIPKRGYRLIAPIGTADPDETEPASAIPALVHPPISDADDVGETPDSDRAAQVEEPKDARRYSLPRTALVLIAVVSVLLLAGWFLT
ncbi:MAG TPA: transcriptional regulator [Vicinamibacterales bacterium]|jgi:DNA-binding winged helix-turn-helix (wHTH) protein